MALTWRDIQSLLEYAIRYDRQGDVYNATKLYKKLIKVVPNWSLPYHFLSILYKNRKEWKPSFHYSHQAICYNPEDSTAWRNLAISATALQRWQVARRAWNQLGYQFKDSHQRLNLEMGAVPICLNPDTFPEIVWGSRIDPARARIESIPQPASNFRWRAEVLLDASPVGHKIVGGKRISVYNALDSLKLSYFHSWLLIIDSTNEASLRVLERLCAQENMGFDNWSNAHRQYSPVRTDALPEYYSKNAFIEATPTKDTQYIALAARSEKSIRKVLHDWRIITLQSWSELHFLS